MNQFENQCRRRLNNIQCLRTHIQGHYFCSECIEDVEERKKNKKLRCNSEYIENDKRIKCQNERMSGNRKCYECVLRMDNRRRYFTHRINKDLVLDLKA
jgi:hypothetical protein